MFGWFSFLSRLKPKEIEEYPETIVFPLTVLRSSAYNSVEAEAEMRFIPLFCILVHHKIKKIKIPLCTEIWKECSVHKVALFYWRVRKQFKIDFVHTCRPKSKSTFRYCEPKVGVYGTYEIGVNCFEAFRRGNVTTEG